MFLQPMVVPAGAKKLTMSAPGDTTIVDFDSINHQPHFLKNGRDTIAQDYTIESVVFKSGNGNLLNGWFVRSKDVAPDVTLLHVHGNGGFVLTQYMGLVPLLKYGFQFFVFDYSGYGFSKGESTRNNILADAHAALTYLKTREDVGGTRVVVYGQSLGGHLSAVLAEQRQHDIDALVIEGAFSSHKDIAAEHAGFIGRWLVTEPYSASKSIRDYKKPVLVIHSTEDEIIPYEMGQKLFSLANEPKSFYEIRHCHICGPENYPDSISAKIYSMLR
jgi:fermentation-respiration switch protein FrsA (DUF1100 family)